MGNAVKVNLIGSYFFQGCDFQIIFSENRSYEE